MNKTSHPAYMGWLVYFISSVCEIPIIVNWQVNNETHDTRYVCLKRVNHE